MRNLKAQVNIGEAHTAYSLADSFIFHTLSSDSADEKNNKEDFIRQIKPESLHNSIPVEQREFYICLTDRKKGVPCISVHIIRSGREGPSGRQRSLKFSLILLDSIKP